MKKKLTEAEEKAVDEFTERLAQILLRQVEEEAIAHKGQETLYSE